jgi:hypothetical protein
LSVSCRSVMNSARELVFAQFTSARSRKHHRGSFRRAIGVGHRGEGLHRRPGVPHVRPPPAWVVSVVSEVSDFSLLSTFPVRHVGDVCKGGSLQSPGPSGAKGGPQPRYQPTPLGAKHGTAQGARGQRRSWDDPIRSPAAMPAPRAIPAPRLAPPAGASPRSGGPWCRPAPTHRPPTPGRGPGTAPLMRLMRSTIG